MKKRNLISLILAFVMLTTFLPVVFAENVASVTVLEDVLVRTGSRADINFGTADQIWVSRTDSSYLKFDVTSLRNAVAGKNAKYILSLTSRKDSAVGGDINLYGITGENRTAWSETTLTYNMTHQVIGNGMDSDVSNLIETFNVTEKDTEFNIDVTSYINIVPDDGIASFKLQNTSITTDAARFYSKENTADKPATLTVVTEAVEEPEEEPAGELVGSLNIEDFIPDVTAVSEDFLLPLTNLDETITYTWESDDTDVLKIYGENVFIVSNPDEREVNLTVTAKKGDKTETRSFALTVLPSIYTGEYIINEDFEDVKEGELPDDGKWLRESSYSSEQANHTEDGELNSYMGAAEKGSTNALRIYKKAGFRFSSKFIHCIYACFGEIDKDSELVVSYDILFDDITNDAMIPRFTDAPNNAHGSQLLTLNAVKNGSDYQIVVAQNKINSEFGTWNSITTKSRMSSDPEKDVYNDVYVGNQLYKIGNVVSSYAQNMMFGTDTNAAKGIDFYIDNVKVFLNDAQQIANEITPETIGATKDGNVIDNLNLTREIDGAKINYFCTEDGVIADDGTVTHPDASEGNKNIILNIVVEKDGYKGFAEMPLSVVAFDDDVNSFLDIDINSMLNAGETADAIVTDFNLLENIKNIYPLTWESSNEDAIRIEDSYKAVVIRNVENMPVTLTVKMDKDGINLEKKFNVKVKKLVADIDIDEIIGADRNAVSEDFMLPEKTKKGEDITWESSDANKLFIFDNKAYVFCGSEEKEVTLSAKGVFEGSYAKFDYTLKLSPIVVENKLLADEDFEDTELGKLPSTKLDDGNDMWVLNNSISANDPNQYNYVVEENSVLSSAFLDDSNKGNKVLQAGKKDVDNTQALVHMLMDSPMETVVNLEFDVYAEGPSHGHIWLCNNKAATLSGDILRLPMKTSSLYISDAGAGVQLNYGKNTWHNVKLQMDMSNYKYNCTVDGVLKVEDGPLKQNGNILSQITFGFGKGLYGYNLVDNIKAWVDIEKSVDAFTESIRLGDITQVTSDLKLPALTPCGDADITWLSSDPAVLNDKGRVNRPAANEADVNVKLYALVTANNIRAIREFDVTVKSEKNDKDAVEADFNNLILDTSGYLMTDVPLLKKGIYGSDIIWKSSHPDIIDPETGKLTAKQFDDMQITSVTLTAYVKKGTEKSGEKSFIFSVPERNYILNSNVEASSDRIDVPVKNVKDNDSDTYWGPDTDDEEKYIIVMLPGAAQKSVRINKITAKGSFGGVNVYVSNSTSGDAFTKVGASSDVDLSPSLETKRVKLEFSGDNINVSDIGIYYIVNDNLLAEEDAACVSLGNTSNIIGDISLPLVGEKNGSIITWKSDKPEIISDSGKLLVRPAVRTQVKLTMTVKYGTSGVAEKSFNVYVAAMPGTGGTGGGGGGSFGGGGKSSGGSYAPKVSSGDTGEVAYFNDIADYGWAKEYINSFAIKGILSVAPNGKFEPGRAVTRAEFLKILLLAFGISGNNDANISFADVSPESWYYNVVKQGVSCGIINGVSDTEFAPDANITRQDIAVMLKRVLAYCNKNIDESKTVDFTDSYGISGYAYDAVMSLGRAGIINGYEDGSFAPGGMASRAEAVVLVGRATK